MVRELLAPGLAASQDVLGRLMGSKEREAGRV